MKPEDKNELTQWALAARRLWLFLDYDGTLADFAPTPDHIEPDPRLIHLLEDLARNPALRITILSGRRLGHIRRLLPLSGIFLAGSYGLELLTPGGETIHRVDYEKIRPFLDQIGPKWEQAIGDRNGFYLEDKGWAIALHARFADDADARQVLAQARQAVSREDLADGFRILGGHKFLEIAPSLASKRDAVSYLLERYPLPEARLLYIGDDDKDEEAFSLIHAKGGGAVKVRQPSQASQPTEADFFLDSPKDTVRWLENLANLDADP
ncbi:MAG TPA: trehalose-phosphatase [Anaerolineales bacterium]|nr:trehalose-phosphatase [Anaerolineales bacterium]